MTQREIRETIGNNTFVVLLDNTPAAHRLSLRLYFRFGIVSYICGEPRTRDLIDFSSRTLRIGKTSCARLRAEELTALADSQAPLLPLLIPCSKEACEFAARYAEILEGHYLLLDARTALVRSPLTAAAERLRGVPYHS